MINEQVANYKNFFYERDEFYNEQQRYDVLLGIEEFRPKVEEELKRNVDEILREELIILRLSIDQMEESRKKSKKKRRKKKKIKDLIENR